MIRAAKKNRCKAGEYTFAEWINNAGIVPLGGFNHVNLSFQFSVRRTSPPRLGFHGVVVFRCNRANEGETEQEHDRTCRKAIEVIMARVRGEGSMLRGCDTLDSFRI